MSHAAPPPMEWLGGPRRPGCKPPKLTPYWEMLLLMLLLPLWWFWWLWPAPRAPLWESPCSLLFWCYGLPFWPSTTALQTTLQRTFEREGRRFNALETNCRLKLLCSFSSLDFIVRARGLSYPKTKDLTPTAWHTAYPKIKDLTPILKTPWHTDVQIIFFG